MINLVLVHSVANTAGHNTPLYSGADRGGDDQDEDDGVGEDEEEGEEEGEKRGKGMESATICPCLLVSRTSLRVLNLPFYNTRLDEGAGEGTTRVEIDR